MQVQKVTDPLKIVTDPVMLAALARQGIDQDYVELQHDYAPRSLGKGYSPYSKLYRDLKSGKQFMVFSGLPMVDADGKPVEVGWETKGNGFAAKSNLFTTEVDGLKTTLSVCSDQPDGGKAGHEIAYRPRLFLDGAEQVPMSENATLLAADPLNGNCSGNTLEWDFGICKRRLRIIEGRLLGYWLFESNPGGEVEILYNQQGDFKLRLGQYATGEDRETIPLEAFNKTQYPFTAGDSLTFYPDANPETSSVDGDIGQTNSSGDTWANIRGGAGNLSADSVVAIYAAEIWSYTTTNTWQEMKRGIFLFDTSSLPDDAAVSAAIFSLYGAGKSDTGSWTPNLNVYSSAPAANTALAAGDYDSLGATAFCDTAITYSGFSISGYNDFALNASGIAAISKTGVTKLGIRNANYDVANSAPGWASAKVAYLEVWSAEKGTGYKPKLVVTYTTSTAVSSSDSGAGTESSSLIVAEAKTSNDSGNGAEAMSLRGLGAAEAGSAIEGSLAAAAVIGSDGGTGNEIGELMKSFYSSDEGSGADGLKMISGKAGADMRLRGQQGQVGLPHKEVNL